MVRVEAAANGGLLVGRLRPIPDQRDPCLALAGLLDGLERPAAERAVRLRAQRRRDGLEPLGVQVSASELGEKAT